MSLYLGGYDNFSICINNSSCNLKFPNFNNTALITSDKHVLKDENKMFLFTKEQVDTIRLVTSDNYTLKGLDKLYLIPNEKMEEVGKYI